MGKNTHQITEMGIARTFQNIRLYKELSVIDNVKIGFHDQMNYSTTNAVMRNRFYWKEEANIERQAMELLAVFDLQHLANAKASNLPYGAQRKLEIARALASKPRLLLLDEPAAGMNPTETAELMNTIRLIRDRFHVAILLIEHDMSLVMGICERIIVLDYGQVIANGTPEEIRRDPKVIGAYLGGQGGERHMLKASNLHVYYGAIHAIKDVSFHVDKGEIVTLIGANGAGKSTILNTISGLLRPRVGSVEFMDKNITGMAPHKIVRSHLVQVPEGDARYSPK